MQAELQVMPIKTSDLRVRCFPCFSGIHDISRKTRTKTRNFWIQSRT